MKLSLDQEIKVTDLINGFMDTGLAENNPHRLNVPAVVRHRATRRSQFDGPAPENSFNAPVRVASSSWNNISPVIKSARAISEKDDE